MSKAGQLDTVPDEDTEVDSCVLSHIVPCINNAHQAWSSPPLGQRQSLALDQWARLGAGNERGRYNWSSECVTFYLVHLLTQSTQIRDHRL